MPAAVDGQSAPAPTDAALEHAHALLRSTPLIDGHNDLPWEIRRAKDHPFDVAAYDLRQPRPKHTDLARRMIAHYPDRLSLALTADDIERAFKQKRLGSLLGIEGGHAIENSLGA